MWCAVGDDRRAGVFAHQNKLLAIVDGSRDRARAENNFGAIYVSVGLLSEAVASARPYTGK